MNKRVHSIAESPDPHCVESGLSNLVGIKVSRLNQTHASYHKMLCPQQSDSQDIDQRCLSRSDRNSQIRMPEGYKLQATPSHTGKAQGDSFVPETGKGDEKTGRFPSNKTSGWPRIKIQAPDNRLTVVRIDYVLNTCHGSYGIAVGTT